MVGCLAHHRLLQLHDELILDLDQAAIDITIDLRSQRHCTLR